MDSRLLVALVVGLQYVAFISAVSRFGDCWVFGRRDVIPEARGYQADCVSIKKVTYCRFYPCPHVMDLDCVNLIVRNNSFCFECIDKCVYEEEIYSVDAQARIDSKDKVNTCYCTDHGLECSKFSIYDVVLFCEA